MMIVVQQQQQVNAWNFFETQWSRDSKVAIN
jgi:hypothetical protein